MTDRETLYRGASHAAWGYFFLYLDINLGALNILPDWAAYLLFLSAIGKLQGERRDLALLRPLGILLALWNGADWGLALFGGSVTGHLPPVDLVISVVQLYFHFQFLTDGGGLPDLPAAGLGGRRGRGSDPAGRGLRDRGPLHHGGAVRPAAALPGGRTPAGDGILADLAVN